MSTYEPKVTIRQGYWKAAGNIFHWVGDGYHIFGVGIDIEKLKKANKYVRIHIGDNKYRVYKDEAREFDNKYHARKQVGKVKLVIVSKDLLKT